MESRRLIVYLVVLLIILIGMLAYLSIQMCGINREARKALETRGGEPDLVNGGSIYEKGMDLAGKMIPISGGPSWYVTDGGGCAVCHGQDGRGGKPVKGLTAVPPNIRRAVKGPIVEASVEKFTGLVKWGERPGGKALSKEMPRFDVPRQEMVDLMEYIKQL
jgi:mono/diheme cytochrome c family protein